MRIIDILSIESIAIDIATDTKENLLNIMLDLADKSGKVINLADARKEVFARESIMSTGVGKEIAMPHAKTNAIKDTVGALGILANPVDYETIDGVPVSIVFLLLGLENNVGIHLRLLSKISRLLTNDDFQTKLKACRTNIEIYDLFKIEDENE